MTAGFQMIGDSGSILIDENSLNLQFLEKGTQILNAKVSTKIDPSVSAAIRLKIANSWMNGNGIGYPGFAGERFIAFRAKNGYPVGIGYDENGQVVFVGYNTGTTPPEVDWWAFGRAPVREHGEGLEVFNAAGQLVFSSQYPPMKIAAGQSQVSTASSPSITAAVAGNYALCAGWAWPAVRPGDYEYNSGEWHFAETMPLWGSVTSTGFNPPQPYATFARRQTSTPTGVDWSGMKMTLLLVDVSGL